jgi:hypothetical protein
MRPIENAGSRPTIPDVGHQARGQAFPPDVEREPHRSADEAAVRRDAGPQLEDQDRIFVEVVPLVREDVEHVRADEAGDGDPAGQAADVFVGDPVPLGVAAQQARADQDTRRDDHAERLDRDAAEDRELEQDPRLEEREPGGGHGERVHAEASLHQGARRAMIAA